MIDIEQFIEKIDLEIKLMLFLYISFYYIFVINLVVMNMGKYF